MLCITVKYTLIVVFLPVISLLVSCKEAFEPDVNNSPTGYLIVEGFINSDIMGTTQIKLSRTGELAKTLPRAETKALVAIIGENQDSYLLKDTENGFYESDPLTLSNQRYRLKIKTLDGREYLSDFEEKKQTPEIDSVSWKRTAEGVRIFVHSHDDLNKARYYKWIFKETWEIRSVFKSLFSFVKTADPVTRTNIVELVPRDSIKSDLLFFCWKSNSFNGLLLGSTARLSKDIINHELTFIPNGSERLGVLYSILVEQIALSKEEYDFLSLLKRDTEANGSIFSQQPTALKGNVRCVTNASERVIGYVGYTAKRTKRIFILNENVNWDYGITCDVPKGISLLPDTLKKYAEEYIPLYIEPDPAPPTLIIARNFCTNCLVRGGSNTRPSFWPN